MTKRLALAAILILIGSSSSAFTYEPPWAQLRDIAARYLDTCVEKKDIEKRHKKFRSVVEGRLSENDSLSEDGVMRSVMLDWAAGAKNKIKKKERDAIVQACYYFVVFYDKGYDIPQLIRAELTEKVVAEIIEYLDAEIAKGKK